MPKIQYKEINFRGKSLELINLVNQVINEYKNQGYELTLRQTYYQLVARGYIPNNERSYKNIGNLINDGRLAGLIDWYSIVDRTRNLRGNSHWDKPENVIASARYSYLLNKWDGQPNYVEVWVEKDALVDIVGQACIPLDTPYFSCRGYTSQSEMWSAAQRFIDQSYRDNCYIIHLGDHDPSGIDMTRDIQERLQMFGADVYTMFDQHINEEIDQFVDAKKQIIKEIRGLRNKNMIQILTKVYVQFKTVKVASQEMKKSYSYTVELHNKALSAFEDTYKNLTYLT